MPPLIENKEAATRLARAIVSDVSLYNEAKIVKGIEEDNLFDSLSGELEEGRELYKSRVNPAIDPNAWFYDRAVVDVLIRPKGHIRSKIW